MTQMGGIYKKADSQPIPVDPFFFATWLAVASLSDTTASPTETRCETIAFFSKAALVALANEATLRWDDFADTLLGDFIVTHDFVRVFLVDTETDNCKSGQWATFSVS